jgi:hypothetical protein
MNDEMLKKLSHLRYWTESHKERLKHGRHDQRQHGIWAEGMGGTRDGVFSTGGGGGATGGGGIASGAGGGIVGGTQSLAQRLSLASRRKKPKVSEGQTSFFDMINFSNESGAKSLVTQLVSAFTQKRNKERLPYRIDVEQYKSQMTTAGKGVSDVQKFDINGETYFYRGTPFFWGGGVSFDTHLWSTLYGPLKALGADNIASALGLPLAPVAQETNEGLTVTNNINIIPYLQPHSVYTSRQSQFLNNPTPESYNSMINFVEPLAIMDLIIGQNDGHMGNVIIVDNPNRNLYNAEEIMSSVDYDLSGRTKNHYKSMATDLWFESLLLGRNHSTINQKGLLSDQMREILQEFSQNVQWHQSIPRMAREEFLTRVQAILDLDANADEFYENVRQKWGDRVFQISRRQDSGFYRASHGATFAREAGEILDDASSSIAPVEIKDKISEVNGKIKMLEATIGESIKSALTPPTTELAKKASESLNFDVNELESSRKELIQNMRNVIFNIGNDSTQEEVSATQEKLDAMYKKFDDILEVTQAYKTAMWIATALGGENETYEFPNQERFNANAQNILAIDADQYDSKDVFDNQMRAQMENNVREIIKDAITLSFENGTFTKLSGILNQYAIAPDFKLAPPPAPNVSSTDETPDLRSNVNADFFRFFSGKGSAGLLEVYMLPGNVINTGQQLQTFVQDVMNAIQ